MSKNELKNLALMAKQRLRDANYTNKQSTYKRNDTNSYFVKNIASMKKMSANCEFVSISDKEDLQFLKKVHSILSTNEDILNPIGKLVDKDLFKTLDSTQKQQYILKLCDRYNEAKIDFYHKKEAKI